MNKLDSINRLLNMTNNLSFQDYDTFKIIVVEIKVFVKNTFGEKSNYLNSLKKIRCQPIGYTGKTTDGSLSWENGIQKLRYLLTEIKLDIAIQEQTKQPIDSGVPNKVFIVHGHDIEMKEATARFLEKLKMEVIILDEKPNQGRTIYEKFLDYSDVKFAIVLISPDDIGYSKKRKESMSRARQNVIFELGFFIGKLGEDRVLSIFKESNDFEIPSDYSGVTYIPYDNQGAWKLNLATELNHGGFMIDLNILLS